LTLDGFPITANQVIVVADITASKLVYTPIGDESGSPYDFFDFTVNDGDTDSVLDYRITINVTPDNDAPTDSTESFEVTEDNTLNVNGVLDNANDVEGDALTAVLVNDVSDGTLTLNEDGTFTYVPDENFFGDDQFTYHANDGKANGPDVVVTITVTPDNDDPTAVTDSFTVDEDSVGTLLDVLSNDIILPDAGETLTVSDIDARLTAGAAVPNADESGVLFSPSKNHETPTSFIYTTSDGNGGTSSVSVTVNITPVPDDPQASDDQTSTSTDTAVDIPVLDNDNDPDAGDTKSIFSVGTPTSGFATTSINGDNTIKYTPNSAFSGSDSFTYIMEDSTERQSGATVSVTVAILSAEFDLTSYILNHAGTVTISDSLANTDSGTKQTIQATVTSFTDTTAGGSGISIDLEETTASSGIFLSNNLVVFTDGDTDAGTSSIDSTDDVGLTNSIQVLEARLLNNQGLFQVQILRTFWNNSLH